MKTKLRQLMQNYYSYHSKSATVWTHFAGIPLVTFSLFIFFGWIKISVPGIFSLSIAWIGVIFFVIYYLLLDFIIGALASILLIILCALASLFSGAGPNGLSIKLFLITFILGWVFQLVGHAIEGKRPALIDNFFESIFIAPFFISAELLFMLGIKRDIQQAMQQKS